MRRLVCCAILVMAGATYAFAQANDPSIPAGNIDLLPDSSPVLEWILGGVCLLAALAIGLNPSKRSTQ